MVEQVYNGSAGAVVANTQQLKSAVRQTTFETCSLVLLEDKALAEFDLAFAFASDVPDVANLLTDVNAQLRMCDLQRLIFSNYR